MALMCAIWYADKGFITSFVWHRRWSVPPDICAAVNDVDILQESFFRAVLHNNNKNNNDFSLHHFVAVWTQNWVFKKIQKVSTFIPKCQKKGKSCKYQSEHTKKSLHGGSIYWKLVLAVQSCHWSSLVGALCGPLVSAGISLVFWRVFKE